MRYTNEDILEAWAQAKTCPLNSNYLCEVVTVEDEGRPPYVTIRPKQEVINWRDEMEDRINELEGE